MSTAATADDHLVGLRLADRYRRALRNVAAAVAVVTAFDEDGDPHGTTVSAFAPLSMDPALLLVSLDKTSRLLALVEPGRAFGVNVLDARQPELARRFADPTLDRWKGIAWHAEADVPALDQRHAFIGSQTVQLIPAGDHVLVIGAVREADGDPGRPLTYWQRGFGTHQAV